MEQPPPTPSAPPLLPLPPPPPPPPPPATTAGAVSDAANGACDLDVHAWAARVGPHVAAARHLLPDAVSLEAWHACAAQIVATVFGAPPGAALNGAHPCVAGLAKVHGRWRPDVQGYRDPEMGDVNVAGLFVAAWEAARVHAEWGPFAELLAEIGPHCVAGDSTRLFWFWWARQQQEEVEAEAI